MNSQKVFPVVRQCGSWIRETAMLKDLEFSFQNNEFSQEFSHFFQEMLKLFFSFLFR